MGYFVIAELYRKGFIIGNYDTLEIAEKVKYNIAILVSKYEFSQIKRAEKDLKKYRSYIIRNELYYSGGKSNMSNGAMSIIILELHTKYSRDKKYDTIEDFINEREFQSTLFILD